jgi:uncharacterized protein (DUF433 family)
MNKIEIEFANGEKTEVDEMNSIVFDFLQEKHKSPIVHIDGQNPAFWGMTESEIQKEFTRIKNLKLKTMKECKKYLVEAKAKQWTISISDLMETFGLTEKQVRECINSIYG